MREIIIIPQLIAELGLDMLPEGSAKRKIMSAIRSANVHALEWRVDGKRMKAIHKDAVPAIKAELWPLSSSKEDSSITSVERTAEKSITSLQRLQQSWRRNPA